MKTVFVDTNVLVSGVFFYGPEATLLDTRSLLLVTAEVCERELEEVAVRKSDAFGVSEDGAREMVGGAVVDIDVVPNEKYEEMYDDAVEVVGEGNDAEVLAAALMIEPDYFVTGDEDFHVDDVEGRVNVVETRKVLGSL
jgi:predicted nucleic acid-binding protein